MKYVSSHLLLVILLCLLPVVGVYAQDDVVETDDFTIEIKEGNILEIKIHNQGANYRLPDDILTDYSEIEILIINGTTQFTHLPPSIEKMTKLQELVWSSGIAFSLGERSEAEVVLPPELVALDNLYYIALDVNISDLPDFLRDIPSLSGLNLHNNGFEEFPNVITELPNLETLILSSLIPLSLPDEIASDNLQAVTLSSLGLTIFPPFLLNQANLEYITLEDNNITELPSGIGSLSSLKLLYLAYNQIAFLPDEIVNLESISTINLHGNVLTSLPENIGEMSGMRHLIVASNQLSTLPESIANLHTNESVDVRNNQLETLPDSLHALDDLCFLRLNGNDNLHVDSQFASKFANCSNNLSNVIVSGTNHETVTEQVVLPIARIALIVLIVLIVIFAIVAIMEKRRHAAQSKRKISS